MASLNHVCMWSEHGWIQVTAEEAAIMHPGGTVSAHSGLFMCDLCGQYVTLTDGCERIRYFKHSANEANKNCPERTFGPLYTPTYDANNHGLPIKLIVTKNDFRLELGLLYVLDSILKKQSTQFVTIKGSEGGQFVFSFERLNPDSITYLPIGSEPSQKYEVFATNELSGYWPRKVSGIDRAGSVFDCLTGKLLPVDADVQVNRKYYILTARSYTCLRQYSSIKINKICGTRAGASIWNVYEVEATALDQSAAMFFLSLHCRLTDVPLQIQPIWPIHIETPYAIRHNSGYMIINLTGSRTTVSKAFPRAHIQAVDCPSGGQVIKIDCNNRQQLISAGSANVLQYTYLWKENLFNITSEILIDVRDDTDAELSSGVQIYPPAAGVIKIKTHFDGSVIIRKKGRITEKFQIASEKRLTIDNIILGTEIEVLQGLDTVWQVSYCKVKNTSAGADVLLYKKLCDFHGTTISVPHSFGSIISKFANYPQTRKWIYAVVNAGIAPEAAIRYLRNYVTNLPNQQKGKT